MQQLQFQKLHELKSHPSAPSATWFLSTFIDIFNDIWAITKWTAGAVAASLQLLELAKLEGRLTLSQAAGSIKANERTIRDHIQKLVKKGYLTKHGDRKATWYDITKT